MPAFNFRHIKDLYPIFWEKSIQLVDALMSVTRQEDQESVNVIDDGPIVEVFGWFNRATLDVIGSAGMGVEFDAMENPDTKVLLNSFSRKTIKYYLLIDS